MRVLFVALLIAHASVHAVMWTLPVTSVVDDMPFDPDARAGWWPEALGASAAVSLVVMVLFWSPYRIVGIALSAALGICAIQANPGP